ncbi:M23 family metallopeptidase [Clostridium sp.]
MAKVGSTGKSTGSHLHLELIYKCNPINPLDYIV